MSALVSRKRVIDGREFTILGNPDDKSVFINILINGYYENHMVDFYKELLTEDSVCIDAGANIGILSMYMSLTTKKTIYAFEPAKETYDMLVANIKENNLNVQPIQKALSDVNGEVDFAFYRDQNGGSSLIKPDANIIESGIKMKVESITLDNFVKEKNITKLDLLKMDVEGCETLILRGGEETLKTLKPDIVTEYCSPMIKEQGLSSQDYYDLLKKYYENIYVINRPVMQLIKIHSFEMLENVLKRFDTIGDVFATNKKL